MGIFLDLEIRTYAHRDCEPPQEAWQSSLSNGGLFGLLRVARNDKGSAAPPLRREGHNPTYAH